MITTTPLDASLDVGRRIAQLGAWQTEWYQIDRSLEEQLSQFDDTKLHELQQSSHVSNLRRRMEMMLVKEPLAIPEHVLKSLGVRGIREQFAQQFVSLTKKERLRLRSTPSCFS